MMIGENTERTMISLVWILLHLFAFSPALLYVDALCVRHADPYTIFGRGKQSHRKISRREIKFQLSGTWGAIY